MGLTPRADQVLLLPFQLIQPHWGALREWERVTSVQKQFERRRRYWRRAERVRSCLQKGETASSVKTKRLQSGWCFVFCVSFNKKGGGKCSKGQDIFISLMYNEKARSVKMQYVTSSSTEVEFAHLQRYHDLLCRSSAFYLRKDWPKQESNDNDQEQTYIHLSFLFIFFLPSLPFLALPSSFPSLPLLLNNSCPGDKSQTLFNCEQLCIFKPL